MSLVHYLPSMKDEIRSSSGGSDPDDLEMRGYLRRKLTRENSALVQELLHMRVGEFRAKYAGELEALGIC